MQVQLGNPTPHVCKTIRHDDGTSTHTHDLLDLGGAPAITYIVIPEIEREDGTLVNGVTSDADISAIALHLLQNPDVHHLPGHEALLNFVSPSGGLWKHHGADNPTWVWSDNEVLAQQLSQFYGCPVFDADQLAATQDTHQDIFGAPGVGPGAAVDPQMNITQNGRDIVAAALGGGTVGAAGISTTAPTSTAYTLDGVGAPGSTTAYTGKRIVAGSTSVAPVWGKVTTNTNAAPPVLSVDRWNNAATPGGAAATTPLAGPWMLLDGAAPAGFIGLTANSSTPGTPSTATSLTAEITTAGGGLVRTQATFAHTASANTYTLTLVSTANGSDALPVTLAKIGVFNTMVVANTTQTMLFEELLSATATLSAVSDSLTTTETVTLT